MTVLGVEMTDKESIKGWEEIGMCKRSNKPNYVERAEEVEQRAFQNMCAFLESPAFDGWNEDNVYIRDAHEEAMDSLNAARDRWEKEESEPVFIHRRSTVAQQVGV